MIKNKGKNAIALLKRNADISCRLCKMVERGVALHKMQEVNHRRCMTRQAREWFKQWEK